MACDDLENCIAFDITTNSYCNLRFLSLELAEAAGTTSGYGVWPQPDCTGTWECSCRNDCKATIVGTNTDEHGRKKGRCYVKIKG